MIELPKFNIDFAESDTHCKVVTVAQSEGDKKIQKNCRKSSLAEEDFDEDFGDMAFKTEDAV